jgi:Tfp pilus assembly protein PilO
MTAKRLYLALIASFFALLCALVGITYSISGLLQTKSVELSNAKAQVNQLSSQQTGLAKSKRDINRYQDLVKITKAIVPQDKDQAQAVREITNIATANKVQLTSITFPSSTLGSAPTAVSPTAAATVKPNLSQLAPVVNIPGVYNLQITISNNGNNTVSFNQLDAFLRGLENNRRTAAVSTISIQPQQSDSNRLVFSLVINTYIKPS